MGLSAPSSTPNLEDQWISGSFFVWSLPFDLFGMVNANRSSNASADVALEVIGTRKPPHHVKVMVRRGGFLLVLLFKNKSNCNINKTWMNLKRKMKGNKN